MNPLLRLLFLHLLVLGMTAVLHAQTLADLAIAAPAESDEISRLSTVSNQVGPDHAFETPNDLGDGSPRQTSTPGPQPHTLSDTLPWTDFQADSPARFYRVKVGPPLA